MKNFKTIFFFMLVAFGLGMTGIASALDPSIVLYFDFNEGQGNEAADVSGTGNNGAINGAVWVDGKFGKALEFDGDGAHVAITANASLDLTDEMTLMAWIYKPEFLPGNNGETIISKKQGGAYCLEVTGWENRFPEKLSAEPRISGTYRPVSSPDPLPLNEWVHTALTYDGEFVRLLINGEVVTEESWPGTIDVNTANVFVGAESDGAQIDATHGKFKGIIDDVVVANRAFTADEIKAFMMKSASVEPADKLPTCWGKIRFGR